MICLLPFVEFATHFFHTLLAAVRQFQFRYHITFVSSAKIFRFWSVVSFCWVDHGLVVTTETIRLANFCLHKFVFCCQSKLSFHNEQIPVWKVASWYTGSAFYLCVRLMFISNTDHYLSCTVNYCLPFCILYLSHTEKHIILLLKILLFFLSSP